MKLTIGVVLAAFLGVFTTARADDPPPPAPSEAPAPTEAPAAEPTADEPPADEAPDPATPGTPAPVKKPHARMSTQTTPRPHVRSTDDGESRLDKKEDTVAGGKHWRIKTTQGAVHVWIPPGYDRATAGTVVYVHGYWIDADGAWSQYELAKQFKRSKQNAMFIVPDAPQNNDDNVKWPALKDLRKAVMRSNLHLPDGPLVVMGHSGAFRTIMQWVDHRLVDQIILLDAMYSGEAAFDEYIGTGKRADEHKLIVIGAGTAQDSAAFAKKYRFAVTREKLPESVGGFTKRERGAKLLYVRSQYEHMQIVTSGKVIPLLLHLTPLKST